MMRKTAATATKLDGERLLAVPRQPGRLFGLMMNVRTHPQYRRIKQVIDSGALGSLQRVQWTITNWFRPEAYYKMSDWRATWKGEGGGVADQPGPAQSGHAPVAVRDAGGGARLLQIRPGS